MATTAGDGSSGLDDTLSSSAGAETDSTVVRSAAPAPEPIPLTQPVGPSGILPPAELAAVDPGHYAVGPEIARGGMGRILVARDLRLGRTVALKELLSETADLSARFLREALLTARLQHPGIVPVYEAGSWPGGQPFFAMRLVSGRSLKDAVAACVSLRERFALLPHCVDAVEAVAYAHSQHIIHRDLKPANVLVGSFGETVVIDWGLAKEIQEGAAVEPLPARPDTAWAEGHTVSGSVLGSPAYMAPEQARAEPVDERTDVYALGAMLYHVLVGEAPYGGRSGQEVVEKVVAGPPDPVAEREPEVPRELAAIVEKAMARDPAARYRTARELAEDLRSYQAGNLVGAHRYSLRVRLGRWTRQHRAEVALAASALAVLALVGAWAVGRIVEGRGAVTARERQLVTARAQALEERGREELLAGRPLRALPLLSEAYRSAGGTPALRFLLARALRPADAQLLALEGHQGPVTAVAFSPDGRLLLTAGRDGVGLLWDPSDGKLLGRLGRAAPRPVLAAAFDSTGRRAATASADETVQIWAVDTRESLVTLRGHEGGALAAVFSPDGLGVATVAQSGAAALWDVSAGTRVASLGATVRSLAFSPDGATLATGGTDGQVRLFRARDGAPGAVLGSHLGEVVGVAFSPRGDRLASGGADGSVRLWDPSGSGDALALAGPGGTLRGVAFSPDGAWLVAFGSATRLWDAAGAPGPGLSEPADGASAAAFSHDSRLLATAGLDGTARVWDLATGDLVAAPTASAAAVTALAFSPDGRRLATGGWDQKPRLWDLTARRWLAAAPRHPGGVTQVGFAADGATLLTAGSDGQARRFGVEGLALAQTLQAGTGAVRVSWSPDGARALTVADGTARLWDAAEGTAQAALGGDGVVEGVLVGPSAAATVGRDGKGALWATAGTRLAVLEGGDLRGLSTSGDGLRLAARVGPTQASVWDAAGKSLATLRTPDEPILQVVLDQTGALALTAHVGGTAQLWEVASGRRVLTLRDEGGEVATVAFSPDGERLVTADGRRTVRLWAAQGGRPLALLQAPARVRALAFSPDGARVATCGDDGAVRLWEAGSGRLLAVQEGGGAVQALAFSPDGELLATGAADGEVRVWDVHLEGRSAGEVARRVRCRVPYRLVDDALVPAVPEGSACERRSE